MYVFSSHCMSLALEESIDVCVFLSLHVLGDERRGEDRCMCFPLTVCPFSLEKRNDVCFSLSLYVPCSRGEERIDVCASLSLYVRCSRGEERIDLCVSLSLYVLCSRGEERCMYFPLTLCPRR
jgi:hypothetical protein